MKQIPVEQLQAPLKWVALWPGSGVGSIVDSKGQNIALKVCREDAPALIHPANHFRELLDASKPFIQGTAYLTPEHFDRLRSAVAAASSVEMEG